MTSSSDHDLNAKVRFDQLCEVAKAQFAKERWAVAMEVWNAALPLAMQSGHYLVEYHTRVFIADCLCKLGRHNDAIAAAEAVIAVALALFSDKKNAKKGKELIERAQSVSRDARAALTLKLSKQQLTQARALRLRRDYERAYSTFDESRKFRKNDQHHYATCTHEMAMCLFSVKRFEDAHKLMDQLQEMVHAGVFDNDMEQVELFLRNREKMRISALARGAHELLDEAEVQFENELYDMAADAAEEAIAELERVATRDCALGAIILDRLAHAQYQLDQTDNARANWTEAKRAADKWAGDDYPGLVDRIRVGLKRCRQSF